MSQHCNIATCYFSFVFDFTWGGDVIAKQIDLQNELLQPTLLFFEG